METHMAKAQLLVTFLHTHIDTVTKLVKYNELHNLDITQQGRSVIMIGDFKTVGLAIGVLAYHDINLFEAEVI
jgi:hypothetical protein